MKYLRHRVIDDKGISIDFEINNREFTRASMIADINNWRKGQLLWWKEIDTGTYCDEVQAEQLEGILKAFVFPQSFKEQLQLT